MATRIQRNSVALPYLRRGGMAWRTGEHQRRISYKLQRIVEERAAIERLQSGEAL